LRDDVSGFKDSRDQRLILLSLSSSLEPWNP
jgi:hypothetical protein